MAYSLPAFCVRKTSFLSDLDGTTSTVDSALRALASGTAVGPAPVETSDGCCCGSCSCGAAAVFIYGVDVVFYILR